MPKRLTATLIAAALASFAFSSHAFAEGSGVGNANAGAGDRASWQCAQFARMFSGIQIFGDAWTWWEQAMGKYARGFTPEAGSVLVFKPFGPMSRGHVAVVQQVLTDRIIQVTHANWSPIDGQRGQIENNVTVVDVSDPRRLEQGEGLVQAFRRSWHHQLPDLRLRLQGRRQRGERLQRRPRRHRIGLRSGQPRGPVRPDRGRPALKL